MKTTKIRLETALSLALTICIVAVFSLSSFVASGATVDSEEVGIETLPVTQEPTGTLTAKGPVTINGVEAKTGATVLNGSVIATFTGGDAWVEFGPLGRVILDDNTTITLTIADNVIQATLNRCGSVTLEVPSGLTGLVKILHVQDVGVFSERKEVDVKVYRGQAIVKRLGDKEKILGTDDQDEFDDAIEVTATGDAVYKVFCHEDHLPVAFFYPLAGLLLLGGGEESIPIPSVPPVLSPIAP